MTRFFRVAASLMTATTMVATVAITSGHGASADDRAAIRSACKSDAKKFCGNVSPGQGRIRECMQAHLKELSPVCRERIEQMAKPKS